MVQHDDAIRVAYGRQAVRDREDGDAAAQGRQRALHHLLGLGLDDSDPAIDARTLGAASPLNPVVAAHGINEGAGGDGTLVPSF